MEDAFVDPRLERASTLPARWYSDPALLAVEMERVFARTWQLAGLASKVSRPGDYVVSEAAGEPIVLVRDLGGALRALSNVCRHRAGPVAAGEGCRRAFQCGYHGWTWGLDGRLLTTPEFEGVEGFDRGVVRLPEARVEAWGPLLFVNWDAGAEPLHAWMREMIDATASRPLASMRSAEKRAYEIRCNWKVYVDNYLEGYHVPIVHPSLFREIDYAAYRTIVHRNLSLQLAPVRDAGAAGAARRTTAAQQGGEVLYYWVFPNLMVNVYPDNFSTNLILPLGHDRTLTLFEWFFPDPEAPASREALATTVSFSDEIQREDIAICEAVQRGLSSRTYSRGRFSVARESGVHHFHRLLSERLAGPAGDA